MKLVPGAVQLAVEPEIWTIRLRDGSLIDVLTHGYSIEANHCVFSLLFKGAPNYEVTSLRLPLTLLPEDFA